MEHEVNNIAVIRKTNAFILAPPFFVEHIDSLAMMSSRLVSLQSGIPLILENEKPENNRIKPQENPNPPSLNPLVFYISLNLLHCPLTAAH